MERTKLEFKVDIMKKMEDIYIKDFSLENMRYLFEKSVITVFGMLIAAKMEYLLTEIPINLNKEHSGLPIHYFEIEYYKQYENVVKTSLLLVCDLEYDIRIHLLPMNKDNKGNNEDSKMNMD
jgi:hypothetical protein